MENHDGNKGNIVYWLSLAVTAITLVGVVGVSVFQGYVRWKLNQNFTVLGGGELEVLTAGVFALLIGLLYVGR